MSINIDRLRALCNAASAGPWHNGSDPSHFDAPEVTDRKTFAYYIRLDADAAFVAAARDALPAALDEIQTLRGELWAANMRRTELEERLANLLSLRKLVTR